MTTDRTSTRVPVGSVWERWKVLSYAAPARRGGERFRRARVLCQCVCQHKQLVFECDLRAGRSGGCRSMACYYGWHARQQLLAQLSAMPTDRREEGGADG